MKQNLSVHTFTKEFYEQVKKDPIQDWAATLAFYFMLSIFPFLIFILSLLPYLPIDTEQIYHFVHDYAPPELAELFTVTVLEVIAEPKGGLLSFGILATIWTASNGINALIRALNRAHNIDETRSFIKLRSMSIFLTLGIVILFFATLLLPIFGNLILSSIDQIFSLPDQTFLNLNRLRWIIGVVIMTAILMLIYMIAPNRKLAYRDVLFGALLATVSWQLISFGFSIYVANFNNYTATYGSLGGVIILMFWFYLSGLILVVGGEINATLYNLKKGR
ncbi:YihY/virulence factor BrkB family protein [Anaerobacillus isosaccharinicus]|uniref:Ribonuclease n=1 Tax=Anaerobacillus isosaccharinicus TaxID=1532552 RepID=A0A1S2LHD4_9BACI|nr:YihY/virulence factor BrkB family protein [Anaerobacillus isosaccharinicus]MBA5586591.1 YihY/virulence factor BrkB family protein [Anaerobacillus isosaccharinicus]QOY35173.1 YihY/virulence factor BrkB family protein [Anaerobacillus isosaccharinicus]